MSTIGLESENESKQCYIIQLSANNECALNVEEMLIKILMTTKEKKTNIGEEVGVEKIGKEKKRSGNAVALI